MFIAQILNNGFKGVQNFIFEILAGEHFVAQGVNGLALFIHDVVVFDKVFADIEIAAFDAFLRGFD